ncbi:MAG: nucleotidyltransferase domain-containing protein, partial [Firmicutes bacterium]|nr:nucleotidyltransferase domain-containing protein [Bacillota bacterium]
MGRLHEGFDKLTEALAEAAQAIWGPRLKALAVFGSVGRGTPRFDSDLDVLVVLSDLPGGRLARAEVGQALEESLSPVIEKLEQDGIFTELSLV